MHGPDLPLDDGARGDRELLDEVVDLQHDLGVGLRRRDPGLDQLDPWLQALPVDRMEACCDVAVPLELRLLGATPLLVVLDGLDVPGPDADE